MHILLVEDEPELSKLAAATMEGMGHTVTTVAGVNAALQLLEQGSQKFSIMIADHRLPDGWGVALSVQCRVKYPGVKAAVVSGVLTPENIELLEEYGIPYWRKPVLYSTVLRKLLPEPPKEPWKKRDKPGA